jgi:hypothetical protein
MKFRYPGQIRKLAVPCMIMQQPKGSNRKEENASAEELPNENDPHLVQEQV